MELTEEVAYLAMFHFLERQYAMGFEELGGLLGSMALLSDGGTADPAQKLDWQASVKAALEQGVNARLELKK